MNQRILAISTFLIINIFIMRVAPCHYSCPSSCTTQEYYSCTVCDTNRGNGGVPIYGMCYCSSQADEDESGNCQLTDSFNYRSKVLILVFIALTLFFSLVAVFIKGMKYFLYKTIEDVQQLSLIVFINMYFPQQLDIFLTVLYRFNISSYTFENLATSLFEELPDGSYVSTDGQNIVGKYRLLKKTANFFSNQFTWMIVFFSILVFAIIVRFVRNCLKKQQDIEVIRTKIDGLPPKQYRKEQSQGNLTDTQIEQWYQVQRVDPNKNKITFYSLLNRLYNMLWFHLLIVFFYFSLIQLNINIFTQISNLTFSSDFATTGTFFSAFFLAAEIVVLVLLFLKAKEEMIKPEWMRDQSFTATTYLIRTNFKTVTKYFWFISCLKKILIALMMTILYDEPLWAIVAVCSVHATYLATAIYCQPYERKYIRVHFYLTQCMKLFLFLNMITFTTKYRSTAQLITITQIFYGVLALIFGMHLLFLIISLLMQCKVYKHFCLKKCCEEDHPQLAVEKIGYRSQQRVYIYIKE